MSGPRVTSGAGSRQDYGTPRAFLDAVERRFGPIQFDLAAHRGNAKHERYFAPAVFVEKVERGTVDIAVALADALMARGADAGGTLATVMDQWSRISGKGEVRVANADPGAFGFNAFAHDWKCPGLQWLNCEFADVGPWAAKCALEAKRGANIALLTPAVLANWYRDHIAGVADVYELSGRLSFDGKNVFPKDCRLSHFWPGATGKLCIWEWATDKIHREWVRA